MTPSKRRPPGELHDWANAALQTAAELCAESAEHARVAEDLCKAAAELRERATAARHARLDEREKIAVERERIAVERERIADRRDRHADWRDRTAALCEQALEELQRSLHDPATTASTDAITEEINRLHARLSQRENLLRQHNINPDEAPAGT
jgi:hypothetical protein